MQVSTYFLYSTVVDHLHGAPGDGDGVIITPVLVGVTNGGKVEEDGVIDTKEKKNNKLRFHTSHHAYGPTCSCCWCHS